MTKVVIVEAFFSPIGKNEQYQVPTGRTKKSLWGLLETEEMETRSRWVQTGYSDCDIDAARLATDLQKAIDNLDAGGYEVLTITPITSGNYNYKAEWSRASNNLVVAGYGYGYGYSFTNSLIVTAKKK